MSGITPSAVLVLAVVAALAVGVGTGGVVGAVHLLKRRRARREERRERWREAPLAMAQATLELFAPARARLVGRQARAEMLQNQAVEGLEQYEERLPDRPAYVWALLVAVVPVAAGLLYTQWLLDVESFSAMGRPDGVALVLGTALALSLFGVPLFVRLHTDALDTWAQKAGWVAALAAVSVMLVGAAVVVSGSRGEAKFAPKIQDSIALEAWYETEGDTLSADAERQKQAQMVRQRDSMVAQDQLLAASLAAGELLGGWFAKDSLAGTGLLVLKANRRRRDRGVVRKQAALTRHDRQASQAVVLAATDAGPDVLERLLREWPAGHPGLAGQADQDDTDPAPTDPTAVDNPAVDNPAVDNPAVDNPDSAGGPDADETAADAGGVAPSSTTHDDDNL